jgi:hypothetical protein
MTVVMRIEIRANKQRVKKDFMGSLVWVLNNIWNQEDYSGSRFKTMVQDVEVGVHAMNARLFNNALSMLRNELSGFCGGANVVGTCERKETWWMGTRGETIFWEWDIPEEELGSRWQRFSRKLKKWREKRKERIQEERKINEKIMEEAYKDSHSMFGRR